MLLSKRTLEDFRGAARFTPLFIYEDVHLALLARHVGVAPEDDARFSTFDYVDPDSAEFKGLVISHGYGGAGQLEHAWSTIKSRA